jgi:flagellar basal body-associated protein FliL
MIPPSSDGKGDASGGNTQDGRLVLIFNFSLISGSGHIVAGSGVQRVTYQHSGHEAEFDEEFEDEGEERRPRFWVYVLVCLVLAATGSGAAFAWHGYGGGELTTGALSSAPKAAPAQQAAAAQDALLRNLAEAQQRATAIAQRNQELLQAQDAQIKRLSDAVSQLATRVDGLGVRNAQAAVPLPAPKKPVAPKIAAPKPAAPAPLSLAPEGKQ